MKTTKTIIQRRLLLTAVFLFVVVVHVLGQEQQDLGKISTGRPDQTQGTTVVPKKTLQIETGFLYEKNTVEAREAKTHAYPTVSLRYGLLERLELRVDGSFQDSVIREHNSYRKIKGIGPVGAGFRWYIWEGTGLLPQAAFTATVTIPVGASSMVSNHTDTEFRLGFTNIINPTLSLTYTLGYGWVEEGAETKYAFKVTGDLSDRLAVYGEIYGTNAEGARAVHQADAGILFIVRQNMQLDVAAGIGLSRAAPDLFLTTGVSVRLPR